MNLMNSLAYRHLKNNKKQTVFALLAIFLAVCMLVTVSTVAYSVYISFAELANAQGRDVNAGSLKELFGMLYTVAAFLGVIISAGSIVVISNAFSISASERIKQFGILKSVGATKKQIRKTIMAESNWLSLIAIPAGIIVGFLLSLLATWIMRVFLTSGEILEQNIAIKTHFHLLSVAGAAVLGYLTVLLASGRIAGKVSKLSPIESIRQTDDIKMKPGKLKTSRVTQALFGFEGTLAAKSLKRGKRKFRVTVLSLVTSIVLVIIASSFGNMLFNTAVEAAGGQNANFVISMPKDAVGFTAEEVAKSIEKHGARILESFETHYASGEEIGWMIDAANPERFEQWTEETFGGNDAVYVQNVQAQTEAVRRIFTMLMIFIYSFVGMLTLIGVTSVLATINSNISLRTAEFATLQAVGMDSAGLRKMLNLESLLYGIKSLLIGLPLGIVLSYGMFGLFRTAANITYEVPYLACGMCIVGVFAINFISMRFASSKIRKSNIAEAMREVAI